MSAASAAPAMASHHQGNAAGAASGSCCEDARFASFACADEELPAWSFAAFDAFEGFDACADFSAFAPSVAAALPDAVRARTVAAGEPEAPPPAMAGGARASDARVPAPAAKRWRAAAFCDAVFAFVRDDVFAFVVSAPPAAFFALPPAFADDAVSAA